MNDNLIIAKRAKNDEFYTQLCDIEKELEHYPEDTFKDKVVYCPCDVGIDGLDVPKSNFVKYFEDNKERLGYKRLLHTSLQEGYDFHSDYCTQLLKESDIVVTNPPFSLFRDFFKWLMDNDKKFIIIGNKNAINDIDVFSYLKQDKLWLGCTSPKDFYQPDTDKPKAMTGLTRWFTNLKHNRYKEPLLLTEKYSPDKYPKYDNFDAIEVSKVNEIPCDYDGVMGVPITYMDSYNPDQFEIVGNTSNSTQSEEAGIPKIGEEAIKDYFANGGTGHYTANMYRLVLRKGNKVNFPYGRLLIKRRSS